MPMGEGSSSAVITSREVWEQLKESNKVLQDLTKESIKAIAESAGIVAELSEDIESIKTQQADCLSKHTHKSNLCVFADQESEVTRSYSKLKDTTFSFIKESAKVHEKIENFSVSLTNLENKVDSASNEAQKLSDVAQEMQKEYKQIVRFLIYAQLFMIVAYAGLVGVKIAFPGL